MGPSNMRWSAHTSGWQVGGTAAAALLLESKLTAASEEVAPPHKESIEHAKRAQLFESKLNSGLCAA